MKVSPALACKIMMQYWNLNIANDSSGGDNKRAFTTHFKY